MSVSAAPAPVALKPSAPVDEKLQTVKISLPSASKVVPQATVNLKPAPSASVAVAGKPGAAISVAGKPGASAVVKAGVATDKSEGAAASVSVANASAPVAQQEGSPLFAIAAAAVAVISLLIQVWTMLG
jgi:hypothetical protein